jgi:leucyl aminopeptidase (aminopeptidase T)
MKTCFSREAQTLRLINQVVETCLNVKERENVWVQSWDHTVKLASEIALECQRRGARSFVTLLTMDSWMRSFDEVPQNLLEVVPSHQTAALEKTNVFIFMLGPRNPIDWNRIPPEKQELANVWYLGSNKYLDTWMKISRENKVRTLGVEYCLATRERAEFLGLDYVRWKRVMKAGCLADQQEISENARILANVIRKGDEVIIKNSSGTNLKFKLVGRKANIGDSIVTNEDAASGAVKFLPSGFVETSADESSAEGTVVYDVPIVVGKAMQVEGLKLKFRNGKVIEYSAKNGAATFENYLKTVQGGDVNRFGFFGVGLNPCLEYGLTQDDKVLGGVTVGIGGNEDKGGSNRTAGNRHWWAVTTKATLEIDGNVILKNGKIADS